MLILGNFSFLPVAQIDNIYVPMVSRFVFPGWFSLQLPWWDGSCFAFQVGRSKWEKVHSSHESKHRNMLRFKWQCTKVNDTWQKYTAEDGGSSCTILICCLCVTVLFYPFLGVVTLTLPVVFLLFPCFSDSVPPEFSTAVCSFLPSSAALFYVLQGDE